MRLARGHHMLYVLDSQKHLLRIRFSNAPWNMLNNITVFFPTQRSHASETQNYKT
jgi:hypothetical protein